MRIENNYEYNSIELYFEGKPDEMTRETLKMFKWRWNPKKFCLYNKNTTENMALAESLNSSAEEMRAQKVPDSYAEKYKKEEPKALAYASNLVDRIFMESAAQEEKTLKVPEHIEKKPKRVEKRLLTLMTIILNWIFDKVRCVR